MEPVDVAILVPKGDERRAFAVAFDLTLGLADARLGGKFPVWIFTHAGRKTALISLEDQTNAVAAVAATTTLTELDPTLMILLGTAMGARTTSIFSTSYTHNAF